MLPSLDVRVGQVGGERNVGLDRRPRFVHGAGGLDRELRQAGTRRGRDQVAAGDMLDEMSDIPRPPGAMSELRRTGAIEITLRRVRGPRQVPVFGLPCPSTTMFPNFFGERSGRLSR